MPYHILPKSRHPGGVQRDKYAAHPLNAAGTGDTVNAKPNEREVAD
jgi:hypothetical protein